MRAEVDASLISGWYSNSSDFLRSRAARLNIIHKFSLTMVNQFQSETTLIVRDSFNEARSMRIKAKLVETIITQRGKQSIGRHLTSSQTQTSEDAPQQCAIRMTKIKSKQTEHAGRRTEFSAKVKLSGLVKTSINERERMSVFALNCVFRDVIDSFLLGLFAQRASLFTATGKSRPNLHCS